MIEGKSILAIIPARGESKRMPQKNLSPLAGKPLITYTIDAALKSKYIDEVLVSTDNKEIAKVSTTFGANVPFLRPRELGTDMARSIDVVFHTLDFFRKELHKEFDYFILLQPTSPLRSAVHIDSALEFLLKKKALAVISVCEVNHHPFWSNELPRDLSMKNFISKKIENQNSQELPKYFRLNGAIYICQVRKFLIEKSFFLKEKTCAFIMDRNKSIDIDEDLDLRIAECLINYYATRNIQKMKVENGKLV